MSSSIGDGVTSTIKKYVPNSQVYCQFLINGSYLHISLTLPGSYVFISRYIYNAPHWYRFFPFIRPGLIFEKWPS